MVLILPLLLLSSVRAQDVPSGDPAAPSSSAPAVPVAPGSPLPSGGPDAPTGPPPAGIEPGPPPPFTPPGLTAGEAVRSLPRSRGTRWTGVGPEGESDFVDVALHPLRAGIWAVVQRDGACWVTVDGGSGWIEVYEGAGVRFGAASRDEELILDVQARIDELVGSIGDAADEEEAADLQSEAAAAAQDVALGVQGEIEQGFWFDDEAGATTARVGRPHVLFTDAGMLLLVRPDGLRVSPDLGATWVPVLDAPIADAAEVAPGEVLAVGPTGAWVSSDLVQWTQVLLPMPVAPFDLVVDGDVWATGPSGVWRSDGTDWEELPAIDDALTVRPARGGGGAVPLVIGAAGDLFRAEPFDAPADPIIGGPISGVRDIERAPDGSLLAASGAGPYESIDQGRTWAPFASGLLDPRADAIAVMGDEVILVGAAGVYRLDPLSEVVPEAQGRPTELPPFIPLNALIQTSLSRAELRQRVGKRVVAALMPQVQVEYTRVRDEGPSWQNDDPGGTLYDIDGYWRLQTRLTWAPNKQRTGTSFDAEAADDLQVLVVGDDVVVAGDEAPQVLYSKVSRGASAYRGVLSGRVTELYRLRVRLLLDAPPQDVRRAVLRELNLAEVDAKLDVLTGGAVSSWRADPNAFSTP